jgi:hypothetical protein
MQTVWFEQAMNPNNTKNRYRSGFLCFVEHIRAGALSTHTKYSRPEKAQDSLFCGDGGIGYKFSLAVARETRSPPLACFAWWQNIAAVFNPPRKASSCLAISAKQRKSRHKADLFFSIAWWRWGD